MSGQPQPEGQQPTEIQPNATTEVTNVEVEVPVVDTELEGFSDLEREMEQIVSNRKAEKRRDREREAKRADRTADQPADAAQDSLGDEPGTLDGALVRPVSDPAPDENTSVSAGQEGQAAPSITPSISTPSMGPDGGDPPEPFTYHFRDTDFDEQTVQSGLELKAWADSLPPQAHQAINALLSGSHMLVDRAEYERIQSGKQSQPSAQGQPSTQTVTNVPAELTDDDLAELSPAVAASIRAQNQQLQEMAAWRKQQETIQQQQSVNQQQQFIRNAIDRVVLDTRTKYALTDDEFKQLEKVTEQSGFIARLATAYGDPERALREAFDINYEKHFQARELGRQQLAQQSANAQVEQQVSKTKGRKANASVMNPAGNSVPSGNARKPATQEEKRSARVADIAEFLTQGG